MDNEDVFSIGPAGLISIGTSLSYLDWAVEQVAVPADLANRIGELTWLSYIDGFQDIGRQAADTQNLVAGEAAVTEDSKYKLRRQVTAWRAVINERCRHLFLLTPNTVFDTNRLMNGVVGIAPEEALRLLSSTERGDLDEACRCILVGSATAAEFMALRAIECMLRRWYASHGLGSSASVDNKPWGYVIDKLAEKYDGKSTPPELAMLAGLKMRRDEVAHPDKTSTLVDAQSTLLIACSLPVRLDLIDESRDSLST